ncbi:hypothetical protein SAMN05428981_103243 [Bacillus sp. OV194]|nr:hypothetical protein SAMN05428981_103243 [Bacillus sp. OV194]
MFCFEHIVFIIIKKVSLRKKEEKHELEQQDVLEEG